MSDSAREIENLVYTYAERIDAGDLDGVAALFAHGRICGMEDGPPETVFDGAVRGPADVRDGDAPLRGRHTQDQTLHHATCGCEVDEAAGTAHGSAYYCVTQATPDLPLQIIVTGHYRDTFHRIDGTWWFDTRIMFVDQVGDTSHHLKF